MFTMPITTNKPVNLISFSIVLLVIMGLCLCIAPDVAYAVDQEPALPPADGFAPSLYVACPRPSESDSQGWVAVSDGTNVRVFIISYAYGTNVFSSGSHVTIEDINVSGKKITISFYGNINGEIIISHFDSDVPAYDLLGRYDVTSSSLAWNFGTLFTPTYVAFGGCVNFAESSGSVKSFVPIFDDNGYNDYEDIEQYLYNISYDIASIEGFTDLIKSDVDSCRLYLANLLTSVDDDIVPSLSSVSSSLDKILLWIEMEGGIFENIEAINSKLSKLNQISTLLSEINFNLSSIDGLGDSVDALNQVVSTLDDSFSQISQDLQELTSVIESEHDIWQQASSDFSYDSYYDDSVSSWSWFSDLLYWLDFASSNQRSRYDSYYVYDASDPGDGGRLASVSWTSIFGNIFNSSVPTRPGDNFDVPGWDYLNSGGLP